MRPGGGRLQVDDRQTKLHKVTNHTHTMMCLRSRYLNLVCVLEPLFYERCHVGILTHQLMSLVEALPSRTHARRRAEPACATPHKH